MSDKKRTNISIKSLRKRRRKITSTDVVIKIAARKLRHNKVNLGYNGSWLGVRKTATAA